MPNPMYAAASGAMAQSQALDVLADNLANVQTHGFKANHLSFREVLAASENGQSLTHVQVASGEPQTDFSQGDMISTGNALDVALLGEGFFVVQTPVGEQLTRDGAFHVNTQGVLTTQNNEPVLGNGGPIRVGSANARIDVEGGIWINGTMIDKLQVANVPDPQQLVRQGNGLWRVPSNTRLMQVPTGVQNGALEGANVKPVQLMTELVWVQRAYEIYNRSIEISRGVDQKLTSGVA